MIKEIPGTHKQYFISDNGDVYSNKRGKDMTQLKPIERHNYLTVELWIDGKRYVEKIHRLVYSIFVGDIGEGMVIDHIDQDKHNNNVSNLREVTPKENRANNGRQSFGKIRCVAEKDGERLEFDSASSCSRHIGCHPESIRKMLKSKVGYLIKGWSIKILED